MRMINYACECPKCEEVLEFELIQDYYFDTGYENVNELPSQCDNCEHELQDWEWYTI